MNTLYLLDTRRDFPGHTRVNFLREVFQMKGFGTAMPEALVAFRPTTYAELNGSVPAQRFSFPLFPHVSDTNSSTGNLGR